MFASCYPLSFILPIYNIAPYLAECLESILQQAIEKEIILVDDGSTDNSLDIALDYARRYPFITIIYSANEGVSAARNKGLALARGEYVLFLDPDDLLDNRADFASTYQAAKQHQIQVVKGQFSSFFHTTPDKTYPRNPIFERVKGDTAEICSLNDFLAKMFEINWFIQGACFMYERAFLLKNQLVYDERLAFGEDGIFLTHALSQEGKLMEVPFWFMNYRLRDDSAVSSGVSAKRLDSEILSLQILMEKISHCSNIPLKNTLNGVLALFCFFLHRDITEIEGTELHEQYKNALTNEMILYYKQWGIGTSQINVVERV